VELQKRLEFGGNRGLGSDPKIMVEKKGCVKGRKRQLQGVQTGTPFEGFEGKGGSGARHGDQTVTGVSLRVWGLRPIDESREKKPNGEKRKKIEGGRKKKKKNSKTPKGGELAKKKSGTQANAPIGTVISQATGSIGNQKGPPQGS